MATVVTAVPAGRVAPSSRAVPARAVLAVLLALIAVPQLLLWRFLGFGLPWLALGVAGIAVAATGATRALEPAAIPWRRLALLAGLALALCLLGGEGRFFYANSDWQVRDAVLRDLTLHPWPFAFAGADPLMLRLPAAMYLLPALAGKAGGLRVAELALLAQNAAILAALLALGSTLFATARARGIAGAVVIGFSGMDALGMAMGGGRLTGHLEWWTVTQFSSHVTQLFWVPQHAFAGWAAALLFLLWRHGRLTLAGALAPMPLLALWSPLALFGALPFAALAGIETLRRRVLRPADLALPALASLLALPGLLYMAAGSGAVGSRPYPLSIPLYILFEAVELLPLLLALRFTVAGARFGAGTLAVSAACLLAVPWIQIGDAADFSMRASIPALAILAVQIADLLARQDTALRRWQAVAVTALAIGAITPAGEIARALVLPASPAPRCGYLGVVPGGGATYVAKLADMPAAIRPAAPHLIAPHDPKRCWARDWPQP